MRVNEDAIPIRSGGRSLGKTAAMRARIEALRAAGHVVEEVDVAALKAAHRDDRWTMPPDELEIMRLVQSDDPWLREYAGAWYAFMSAASTDADRGAAAARLTRLSQGGAPANAPAKLGAHREAIAQMLRLARSRDAPLVMVQSQGQSLDRALTTRAPPARAEQWPEILPRPSRAFELFPGTMVPHQVKHRGLTIQSLQPSRPLWTVGRYGLTAAARKELRRRERVDQSNARRTTAANARLKKAQ